MEGDIRRADLTRSRKEFPRWPSHILGPVPGLKEMNLACWGLLAGLLITRFLFPYWLQFRSGGAASLHYPPVDFNYFYGIGRIANEYPLPRLYDYSLQLRTFNEIAPVHDGAYGPSPYPPFVALFFSLFARFPILPAFLLWAGVSLSIYLTGIAAVAKDVFPGEKLKVSLCCFFAVAYCPFLLNTLAIGQIAALAVFSVGVAIYEERHAKPFSSGLVLSILVYKPTLLLLVLPMLLLTRRFRALCGFITGAALLLLTTTAIAGTEIWPAYAHFLAFFGRAAGLNGQSVLLLRQYIDLRSFVQAVWGGWSKAELAILIPVAGMIAASLGVLLWRSANAGRPAQSLAWAATLTWTLLLNVYVPVYDSILVSVAAVLTLGAIRNLKWNAAAGWVTLLLVFISIVSWELDAIAVRHGIQLLPIFLVILGIGQLYFLRRAIGEGLEKAVHELSAGDELRVSS